MCGKVRKFCRLNFFLLGLSVRYHWTSFSQLKNKWGLLSICGMKMLNCDVSRQGQQVTRSYAVKVTCVTREPHLRLPVSRAHSRITRECQSVSFAR